MKPLILLIFVCAVAFSTLIASPEPSGYWNRIESDAMKPGRCLLEIDGKKYISGACKIDMDKDGSFQIYENKKHGYFAYVNIDSGGAIGYWNGKYKGEHAHEDLGALTRDGACWRNERAKVCAWR